MKTRRDVLKAGAGLAAMSAFSINIMTQKAYAAEFTMKFAHNNPVVHPTNVRAVEAAEKILEQSGGRVQIQVFPANQLGGETDMLSQVRSGGLEILYLSGIILSSLVPVASINGIGFAFKDYDSVWKSMDGDLGNHVRKAISGFKLIAGDVMWDNGFRQITSTNRRIDTPEDLKGFKIRVPVSPLWTSMFSSLGAAPASINFSELYTALEANLVDGQENPLAIIETAKLYEVQKHCAMTSHMWDGNHILFNAAALHRLPEDLQEIVVTNFNEAGLKQRQDLAQLNLSLRETLEAKGMAFNEPQLDAFRATLSSSGFYREWQNKYGAEAWKILQDSVGALE